MPMFMLKVPNIVNKMLSQERKSSFFDLGLYCSESRIPYVVS